MLKNRNNDFDDLRNKCLRLEADARKTQEL